MRVRQRMEEGRELGLGGTEPGNIHIPREGDPPNGRSAGVAMNGVPDSVQQAAEYFAQHNPNFWKAMYSVRGWCSEHGPIELEDGRKVGIFADGVDYDADAVAEIVPALVSHVSVQFEGTQPEIERTLSLVIEEVPGLEFSIKRTLDKPALTGMLRAGGETAERLKACKTEKARLQVKT